MSTGISYFRPNSAATKYNTSCIFKSAYHEYDTIEGTVCAAGAALPSPGAVVQEYTDVSPTGSTIVCAGTVQKFGDTYGVLLHDAPADDTVCAFVTGGGVVRMNATDLTYTPGEDLYIITATKVIHNVSAAGREYIGTARSAKLTDPTGLPAGKYVDVFINQSEK